MAKRVRWACPNDLHPGVLGPQKPRRDNICRYCLDCSVEAGKLIERVAPSLEKKRAAKQEKEKERAKTQRQKEKAAEAAKYTFDGVNMLEVFERAKKLPNWQRWKVQRHIDQLSLDLRAGRTRNRDWATGHAMYQQRRITVTAGLDAPWWKTVHTILHELAHHAHMERGHHHRGNGYKRIYHDHVFHDKLHSVVTTYFDFTPEERQRAWDLYEKYGGAKKAYSMDGALTTVLREKLGGRQTPLAPEKPRPSIIQKLEEGRYKATLPTSLFEDMSFDEWAHDPETYFGPMDHPWDVSMYQFKYGRTKSTLTGNLNHMEFLYDEVRNRMGMLNSTGERTIARYTEEMRRFLKAEGSAYVPA